MKDRYDKQECKMMTSLGPVGIYNNLTLLTFYTPYWRKVARFLSKIRRLNHNDFKGTSYQHVTKYARQAYKDTKLPFWVKECLRNSVMEEFHFDIDKPNEKS